ncbi:protein phosphatase 2C domain-containing protein [Streptomyces sp. MS06]|uniref:protein phosphatase 2C domain-containing protein n=1 Tax=Streptomyces sp. MS06 TaxID=3385974 RepID=UPI0039A39D08
MSQMPQQATEPKCPGCAEPLEPGDRFCGACGHQVPTGSAPQPGRPADGPGGAAPQPAAGAAAAGRPDAAEPDAAGPDGTGTPAATHLPTDPPGTGSGGPGPAPQPPDVPRQPAAAPQPGRPDAATAGPPAPDAPGTAAPGTGGVRFDRPAAPEEYPLQAPDPRSAAGAGTPARPPAEATPPRPPAEPTAPPSTAPAAAVCVACRAGRVDSDGYCENCGHAQPRERDHLEAESGPLAAVSDRGLRHHRNEDAFAVGHTSLPDGSPVSVAIVCDGVSSATRPDDASRAASRAASESLLAALPRGVHPQQAMHEAIVAASHSVDALAGEARTAREQAPRQNAPACTLVGSVVAGGLLVVGWVGDSRAYWVPDDRAAPAARLTEDDSWAAQMVSAGLMGEAEAYADERAHAITGWLGADAYELEPHTASFKPDRPGVVVVCTDGLWNYAEAAGEMARIVPPDAAARPLHGARVLVGHALDGGGHDNVTVAVVPFPAPSQGAGSA